MLIHKLKIVKGHASKYNCTRLVHFEQYGYVQEAIAREKQIKGWRRAKKIALIELSNPTWTDLAEGIELPTGVSAQDIHYEDSESPCLSRRHLPWSFDFARSSLRSG